MRPEFNAAAALAIFPFRMHYRQTGAAVAKALMSKQGSPLQQKHIRDAFGHISRLVHSLEEESARHGVFQKKMADAIDIGTWEELVALECAQTGKPDAASLQVSVERLQRNLQGVMDKLVVIQEAPSLVLLLDYLHVAKMSLALAGADAVKLVFAETGRLPWDKPRPPRR